MSDVPAMSKALGAAGAVPFVVGALLIGLSADDISTLAQRGLAAYALAIVCFLCGAWWGIALIRRSAALLLLSNMLVVLAWLAQVFLSVRLALGVLALILVLVAVIEGNHPLFRPQPRYYRRMRWWLTGVAAVSLSVAVQMA